MSPRFVERHRLDTFRSSSHGDDHPSAAGAIAFACGED